MTVVSTLNRFNIRGALAFVCATCLLVVVWSPPTFSQTREEVIADMKPFAGKSRSGVDASSLQGKVMCGYQGWFTAEGDGSGRGWTHYGHGGRFEPGACTIDLWPDLSELDDDEKFATAFRHADGSAAQVFSSIHPKTVARHFEWMQQYGIDGVFVQRFAVETFGAKNLRHCNTVLAHCRDAANRHGRAYAVMYDLSGLRGGQMQRVIDDWKLLVDRMKIAHDEKDKAYLHENGKPVVAVWGIGFNDDRSYTLDECLELVRFLKDDAKYGGATVMIGVPTGWRTLDADSVRDERLHDVVLAADIVSPWTVGRYISPKTAADHAQRRWKADIAWCREHGKEYLPVAFPGFSWHNLRRDAPLDQIPRLKGQFLWTQYAEAKKLGATMIYQAMFDEVDEGTAIFKCTNDPPVGESRFLTYEGLPTDHYLWLTGMGGKLLRGEIEPTEAPPPRENARDK
ncbi:MAG: glycoside hydrolase family 71/99-like protein [Pirellulales bacterium]